MKKTIDDIDVCGKRVLIRLDLNVPLDANGNITDDRRIRSAIPTIKKLAGDGARLILMSHLGRPKLDANPSDRESFSLSPVAIRLSQILEKPILLTEDCAGEAVSKLIPSLNDGDVCLLENLRFNPGETIKDKNAASNPALAEQKRTFAKQLAELADVYVNDAFGTCHRDNASMLTVPQLMTGKPRVVGYLVKRELEFLGGAVTDPKRPFVCILGGAKVSDKLGVIRSLLQKCDTILIGGAMAFTFLAADGIDVAKSLTEPDLFDTARSLRKDAGDRLRLPVDSIAAAKIAENAETRTCPDAIPEGMMGLDIGPATIAAYREVIHAAKTVVWNGPMGVFETSPFDTGTIAVARAVADATDAGAITIIGGGDSAAAIDRANLSDRMTHISTGGGASLEFLEGKPFAAIDVLDEA